MNAEGVNVWEKYAGNPVLGGELGTCFDISVSAVNGRYLMWFSWRPRHGIGLAESDDGLHWRPARIGTAIPGAGDRRG